MPCYSFLKSSEIACNYISFASTEDIVNRMKNDSSLGLREQSTCTPVIVNEVDEAQSYQNTASTDEQAIHTCISSSTSTREQTESTIATSSNYTRCVSSEVRARQLLEHDIISFDH